MADMHEVVFEWWGPSLTSFNFILTAARPQTGPNTVIVTGTFDKVCQVASGPFPVKKLRHQVVIYTETNENGDWLRRHCQDPMERENSLQVHRRWRLVTRLW